MFGSPIPVVAGLLVASVLVWQYEDAIRNPHPENMPIDHPDNSNAP
jgi:hypothetical protein